GACAAGDPALGRPLRLPRRPRRGRACGALAGRAPGRGIARPTRRPRALGYPRANRFCRSPDMQVRSDSFEPRGPIPAEFAMGTPEGFGGNRNPHLAWDDVPERTRSFALLCIDPDAPTDPSLVGKEGVEIEVAHPRGEFVHWVMVDIPADVRSIAAGSCSDGVTARGKASPPGPPGARQGR